MRVEAVASRRSTEQTVHAGPSVRNPLDPRQRIRAVLFDLDGTLYRQGCIRTLMAIELSTLLVTRPRSARRSWRALAAYRKAQEELRLAGTSDVATRTQLEFAAERTGLMTETVEQIVNEWMFERPLKYLPMCRAAGLSELVSFLGRKGVELGVLSDYPAEAKLRALRLTGRFSVVLCSSDPDVGAFKPSPRGFLRACERWQLDPQEVLVVGDRVEVDAHGATAAGMPCVIIGRPSRTSVNQAGFLYFSSLERLRWVLDDAC